MSNVLIGIIGVILFIGLALAGAMYLGDKTKTSVSSSLAAQMTNDITQLAAAVRIYQAQNSDLIGFQAIDNNHAVRTSGFLTRVPPNRYTGAIFWVLTNSANISNGTLPVDIITSDLGTDTAAQSLCRTFNESLSHPSSIPVADNDYRQEMQGTIGCLQYGASGPYRIYSRL